MTDNKKIICVVGRTCSGKDTLVQRLLEQFPAKFTPFISYTDRPMRVGETNGKEHYFLSFGEFTKLYENEKPLAYSHIKSDTNPDGYRYMCKYDQIESCNLYVIDPRGVKYITDNFDDIDLYVIYIYVDPEIREERAQSRSDYETKYKTRCEQEDEQFSEYENIFYSDKNGHTKTLWHGNLKRTENFIVHNNNTIDEAYIRFANICLDILED